MQVTQRLDQGLLERVFGVLVIAEQARGQREGLVVMRAHESRERRAIAQAGCRELNRLLIGPDRSHHQGGSPCPNARPGVRVNSTIVAKSLGRMHRL
ncbi:MAG: hypothetical protein DHS20C15_26020 [Planctomycetota bacterium]|nr:MAG: hypothetical protein DHS20C15_26020 [Planctomycetota bacterium]